MIIFGISLKKSPQKTPPLINLGPMMRRGIIYILCVGLLGCANFAASVSGTFIGNIASDRVIKEMDKEKK